MSRSEALHRPGGESRVSALLALKWLLLLELCVCWRLSPPAVQPESAPLGDFSAARAAAVLRRLAPVEEPHPTGSPAQARFRARLVGELERLGLSPEVQSGVACSPAGTCAELHNIVARLPGTSANEGLALLAHYDSVPAGPGAADDGQGVASLLEIARALRVAPPTSGLLLVFTDGEELGLLGARLFVTQHPAADALGAVLNLEARGSRGPSLMFETTAGSAWLIERYASSPRPVSSSLFAAAYRALPNDTDLSVLARRGIQGLNFAFVAGVEHYHTARDTSDSLDWRSVQQQGAAALATLRELSSGGLQPPGADAVFFDLLSAWVVRLPTALMLPAASLALLSFGWCVVADVRREPGYARQLGRAALGLLVAWAWPALLAAAVGFALTRLGALPFPIVANPWPLLSALVLMAGAGASLALRLTRSAAPCRALFDATWLAWIGAGLLLASAWPMLSYLAVLPGFVAALARLALRRAGLRRWAPLLVLASASGAALLWLPPLSLLYPTLGFSSVTLLGLVFAIGLSPFTPLLGPLLGVRRVGVALSVGSIALALGQLACPTYSAEVPQRLALVLDVDTAGEASWLADAAAGPLPPALRAAADFSVLPSRLHPWPGYGQTWMFAAPAEVQLEAAASPRLRARGPSSLRLELEAPESLWALGVRVPRSARLAHASWRGQRFAPTPAGTDQRIAFVPGANRFIAVDLEFDGPAPPALELLQLQTGLPDAGRALELARGAAAVTSGMGDLTVWRTATTALPE